MFQTNFREKDMEIYLGYYLNMEKNVCRKGGEGSTKRTTPNPRKVLSEFLSWKEDTKIEDINEDFPDKMKTK